MPCFMIRILVNTTTTAVVVFHNVPVPDITQLAELKLSINHSIGRTHSCSTFNKSYSSSFEDSPLLPTIARIPSMRPPSKARGTYIAASS